MNTVEAGNQPHKVSCTTVNVCTDNLEQGIFVSK